MFPMLSLQSRTWLRGCVLTVAILATGASESGAQCPSQWTPGFGARGLNGTVEALQVVDFGLGPEIYAGGSFDLGSGQALGNVARWTGSAWAPLGAGMNGPVTDLAVVDFGAGPELYVAGAFSMAGGAPGGWLAGWNGSSWSSTTINTITGGFIHDLLSVPGSPSTLYATSSAGVHVTSGGAWSTLGAPSLAPVEAMAWFDDGTGPALYVGGLFTSPGYLAKWNGAAWLPVGGGTNGEVSSLCVHDDGSGPALYVGGAFTLAGGVAINGLARWDGQAWSAVGG